jgi:hypothetical protein
VSAHSAVIIRDDDIGSMRRDWFAAEQNRSVALANVAHNAAQLLDNICVSAPRTRSHPGARARPLAHGSLATSQSLAGCCLFRCRAPSNCASETQRHHCWFLIWTAAFTWLRGSVLQGLFGSCMAWIASSRRSSTKYRMSTQSALRGHQACGSADVEGSFGKPSLGSSNGFWRFDPNSRSEWLAAVDADRGKNRWKYHTSCRWSPE